MPTPGKSRVSRQKTAPARAKRIRRVSGGTTRRVSAGRIAAAPSDATATLGWVRQMMREFLEEREWHKYHQPRNLAASISVEAGELLELFQWHTPEEAARRCAEDADFRRAVGEEMCDVMMYCVSLANAMGFDIAQTVAAKMEKNRLKYPAEKFRGHYERPLR